MRDFSYDKIFYNYQFVRRNVSIYLFSFAIKFLFHLMI